MFIKVFKKRRVDAAAKPKHKIKLRILLSKGKKKSFRVQKIEKQGAKTEFSPV